MWIVVCRLFTQRPQQWWLQGSHHHHPCPQLPTTTVANCSCLLTPALPHCIYWELIMVSAEPLSWRGLVIGTATTIDVVLPCLFGVTTLCLAVAAAAIATARPTWLVVIYATKPALPPNMPFPSLFIGDCTYAKNEFMGSSRAQWDLWKNKLTSDKTRPLIWPKMYSNFNHK